MAAPFTPICRPWMNSALSTAFMTTDTMLTYSGSLTCSVERSSVPKRLLRQMAT